MSRWIAFDRDTAQAIRNLFGNDSGEILSGNPITAAIEIGKPCVVILPSSIPGKAVLVRFQPKPANMKPVAAHVSYEATGFLGLSDTPIFDEEVEAPPPKRHW